METSLRILNLTAQGRQSVEETLNWFQATESVQQIAILRDLAMAVQQAHPTTDDISSAIALSGLKSTYTPCVILKKHPVPDALQRVMSLPEDERIKSFRLMLHVLSVADTRRRGTNCAGGCTHEWHNIDSER